MKEEFNSPSSSRNNSYVSRRNTIISNIGDPQKNKGAISNEFQEEEEYLFNDSNDSNLLSVEETDGKEKQLKSSLGDFVFIDKREDVPGAPKVQKWEPHAQKPITAQTRGNRVRNAVARGFGGYVVRPIIGWHIGQGETGSRSQRAKANVEEKFAGPNIQENTNHRTIPGWGGQQFDPNKNTGKDILDDFRRVPTVWAKTTADQATEVLTIREGNNIRKTVYPVTPKVTVYAKQPVAGSSASLDGAEPGHVFLGLEYTRFSRITGKHERYRIRYGFYPHEKFANNSGTAMMSSKGAILPGMLVDDATHEYDISKTYPASDEQIEKIAEASEKYTEEGGYGYFTRNCASFVKDMFEKGGLASLPSDELQSHVFGKGKTIRPGLANAFGKENFRFSNIANAGLVIAHGGRDYFDSGVQNAMKKYADQDETNYQGEGNKIVTRAHFQNYKATKNSGGFGQMGYIPASVGEKLRRLGDSAGVLGSHGYKKGVKDLSQDDVKTFDKVAEVLNQNGKILKDAVKKIVRLEQINRMEGKFPQWYYGLDKSGADAAALQKCYDRNVSKFPKKEDDKAYTLTEGLDPTEIQQCYAAMAKRVSSISFCYQWNLKNDPRISQEVMRLISLFSYVQEFLDTLYEETYKTARGAATGGDISTLRERSINQEYDIETQRQKATMPASEYEAYLQVYKSPVKVVEKYSRHSDLQIKRERKKGKKVRRKWFNPLTWFNGKKAKEYSKHQEVRALAMDYEKSHRYLLNKENFDENDFKYIADLRRMENVDRRSLDERSSRSLYFNVMTMSNVYLAIHLEKMLGGMRKAYLDAIDNKSLQPPGERKFGIDSQVEWISQYLYDKMNSNKDVLGDVIKVILSSMEDDDFDAVSDVIITEVIRLYLENVFQDNPGFPGSIRDLAAEGGVENICGSLVVGPLSDLIRSMCQDISNEQGAKAE